LCSPAELEQLLPQLCQFFTIFSNIATTARSAPESLPALVEIFNSDHYADVSSDQWLAYTPPELVNAHLRGNEQLIRALRKNKVPVVSA
jgi:hypothetical protein